MKHQETETILDRYIKGGYTYQATIGLADIHLTDASKQNIRPTGVIEDRVQQYALAMADGQEFPAIVVYRKGAKYRLLGGVHRTEAARLCDFEVFDAYVAQLDEGKDERLIEVLQRVLNMAHGANPDKEERLMHALRFVALGYNLQDASAMAHLKSGFVRNRQWANEARVRAVDLGLPVLKQEASMIEANRIKNPELFAGVLELARSARLDTDEVKDLSANIRSKATDVEAREVLERWKTNYAARIKATAGGKRKPPTAKVEGALRYLGEVERRVTFEVLEASTHQELAAAATRMEDTIKHLLGVIGRIKTTLRAAKK